MMKTAQQWWQSLVYRERMIVSALAFLVIVLLCKALIWNPLYQGRDNALNSVNAQESLLIWMQTQAHLAEQLRGKSSTKQYNGQSLSQRINGSAKQSKITIHRFQTAGDKSVQVWFEDTAFSTLLFWLEQVQSQYGIQLENIAISETAKQGRVNVRMRLTEV